MKFTPFRIAIEDAEIADLKYRLVRTRWVETVADAHWREGMDTDFLKKLVGYWLEDFDWREQENRLNMLPQFIGNVSGQDIHFIHQRGNGPAPMPLILTHGWPGSFVEMEKIIPLLTDPARFGGDPNDAFDVVVPSLPGYGFSSAPKTSGTGALEVADLWAELMGSLGYQRFAAQGGDLGAGVSSWLARRYPERVTGIHLNFIPGSYRPYLGEGARPLDADERNYQQRQAEWADLYGAYGRLQGTKPQSLAPGLNDSPAGLAAWIAEKFQAWSDCDGAIENAVSMDELLTDISIYWFTQTIGSSFRMYVEGRARPLSFERDEKIETPLGVALFPAELPMPPRAWVERSFNVQRWTMLSKGGHFAALEQPEMMAQDIRAFFRPLRAK